MSSLLYNKNVGNWVLIIATAISLTQFGCNSKKGQEEVSDEIVLKIGKVEITKYEFEKNRKLFEKANIKHGPKALKIWLSDFIDKTYILADAYERGFDTLKPVIKMVDYASLNMISVVNGLVWSRVVTPKLQISDSEIKESFNKQSQLYNIEFLYFPTVTLLDSFLKDNKVIKSEADFKYLLQSSKKDKRIKYNNYFFQWPFDFFTPIRETICKLKEGDVFGPVQLKDGYFVLHLTKKESFKQPPFDKVKSQIKFIIKDIKTQQIDEAQQKEILGKANVLINEAVAKEMIEMFKEKKSIEDNDSNVMNKILMTYYLRGSRIDYFVKDYWDYIYYAPYLINKYEQKETIDRNLKNSIIQQYLYLTADSLGILKEKKYQLDKKNYQNRMVEFVYFKREFEELTKCTEKEILDYYKINKDTFSGNKISVVSFLTFKNKDDAEKNYFKVSQMVSQGQYYNLEDTSVIKNLVSYQRNVRIEFIDKDYSTEIINNIFSIQEKQVSQSFKHKNNYILFFVTKREGKRIKELTEVKEQIQMTLSDRKLEQLKQTRIFDLKKKFPILIDKTVKLI